MQPTIKVQTPLKFNFIKATADSVRFHNTIVGSGKSLAFRLKNEGYELIFLPQKPLGYEAKIFFRLSLNKQIFYLALSPAPPLSIIDASLKDLSLQSLPPDVLALLIEGFSGELLRGLEAKLKVEFSLEDVTFFPPKELFDYKLHINLRNSSSQAEYQGHFWLNQNLMSLFSEWMAKTKPLRTHTFWDNTPLRGHVCLGMCRLPKKELYHLETNDIILLDNSAEIQKQIYSLVFQQSLSLDFQYQNAKATFIKMSETPPNIPVAATPVRATAQASAPKPIPSPEATIAQEAASPLAQKLDALDVILSFEVGEKALSIQALRSITPGFAFELENPVQKPVVIKLNGVPIGQGELLQIGEKVGVRVIEFSHNG